MVTIALKKGVQVDLGKVALGLKEMHLSLEWPAPKAIPSNRFGNAPPAASWDLDIWVLEVDASGECIDLVFYKKFTTDDGAVSRSADDLDGSDGGEQCTIKFQAIQEACTMLVVGITIHNADVRRQHFGLLSGGQVSLEDTAAGRTIAKGALNQLPADCAAVEIGLLMRQSDKTFVYEPVETGYRTVLDWLNHYGVSVS